MLANLYTEKSESWNPEFSGSALIGNVVVYVYKINPKDSHVHVHQSNAAC